MNSLEFEKDLTAVKLLCDQLSNEPNAQNIQRLSNHIDKRATVPAFRYHVDYILLRAYAKLNDENLSKDVRQQLVQLIRMVLQKTRITTLNCFFKLYTALLVQVYDGHRDNMLIVGHEELKESTIKCLRDLIKRTCTDVIESLYVRENAPKFSQGVFTCLTIARTEKLLSLRIAAIETLMTLARVHDEVDSNDVELRTKVADIFMLFLPGIAGGLCQIAVRSEFQNHRITVMSIKAYGRLLSLIMEDDGRSVDLTIDSVQNKTDNVEESTYSSGIDLKLEADGEMKRYIEAARRNRDWLNDSSIKLNVSMRELVNLVRHSNFQVRKELLLAVELMLSKCAGNLTKNLTILVEILILLSEDKAEVVKDLAGITLKRVNARLTEDVKMRPVVQVLEENFYTILTKLPRLIRRSDDAIQLLYLDQLAGYLRLLGKERLPHIMASSSHLRRLVLALVYVAELDCSRVSVLEDVRVKDIEDSAYNHLCPSKCYKFIGEISTEEKLMSICKLLGELGDLPVLVDCILDLTSEMPRYRKEFTLLLNWISSVENFSTSSVVKQINDYYTDPENWYRVIQVQDDVTLGDAQSNIVHCCLLTEGLGIIALNLGKQYEQYLLKTLYLVIERAGSGNYLLNQAGLKSLENIAHSQNCTSVADLLRDNVDYICYNMTMQMRRVERNPGVLNVFSVVMKYSTTMELLPCPKDTVEVALGQLSLNRYQKNCYSLMEILYVFVIRIRNIKTDDVNKFGCDEPRGSNVTSNSSEIVIQSVIDYRNAKKDSEQLDDDTIFSPEDIERELKDGTASKLSTYEHEQQATPLPPPPHIKTTESIIKCCLNFLPSKDLTKSLLAMKIIQEGIGILSEWKEQLLPVVHELWHPLVDRFNDSNVLVINRAWQLLYTIADAAQDFIRSRTLKEVLPSLSKFMEKSAKESYDKNSKNTYEFTQTFKLQKLILIQAASLARSLKLHERQLWQMLEIVQPYLSAHQHNVLQEYCVQLFKDVALFKADIVWVMCLGIWNCHVAPIPVDNEFTVAHLKDTTTTTTVRPSDYRTNVESILTWVEQLTASDM